MRRRQSCEGDGDEQELCERGGDSDPHQLAVARARAPERHGRLDHRNRQRQRQREMSGLDDHGFAVSPSCQRPCFLRDSTTSRGM